MSTLLVSLEFGANVSCAEEDVVSVGEILVLMKILRDAVAKLPKKTAERP